MNGNNVVASPCIVVCFALPFTFPQDIASATKAPLKLPSHSEAVVIETA